MIPRPRVIYRLGDWWALVYRPDRRMPHVFGPFGSAGQAADAARRKVPAEPTA